MLIKHASHDPACRWRSQLQHVSNEARTRSRCAGQRRSPRRMLRLLARRGDSLQGLQAYCHLVARRSAFVGALRSGMPCAAEQSFTHCMLCAALQRGPAQCHPALDDLLQGLLVQSPARTSRMVTPMKHKRLSSAPAHARIV